jgi:hypothetical protein
VREGEHARVNSILKQKPAVNINVVNLNSANCLFQKQSQTEEQDFDNMLAGRAFRILEEAVKLVD